MNLQPSFDTWTTIFLFAAIQGLFVSIVLIFVKKENRVANILLASLLLLFSVTLIEYVLYWTRYQIHFPHSMSVSEPFPFLFGVILWFYFRQVFENRGWNKRDLLHLLPFLINVLILVPQFLAPAEIKIQWMQGIAVAPPFHWPAWMHIRNIPWPWLKIAHMSLYALLIFRHNYAMSQTNQEVKTWFNWLNGLFAGFIFSYASYFILVRFTFFSNEWDYMISFAMMFFIYFIAWFGYLQPAVFSGFTLKESIRAPIRYKTSALTEEVSLEILDKLEKLMDEKKLYRENDLRLESLADALHTSRHNLSQVINEKTGFSFFDYINQKRIHEARQLLTEKTKKEMNVIEIAYAVGFNNKVSFNATFKKITGVTPTEYRKKISEEKIFQTG